MFAVLCCAALVAAGVAIVLRWGALPSPAGPQATSWPRWLARWAAVALASGLVAGVLAAGAGGRLVMRLLAATSPDSAGQLTEAEATIGRISIGGTLAFLAFAGVAFGLLSGVLYLAVGRLLPDGRLRGVLFGLLLLVLGSTRLDPLRADNFDFNLVGPGWLAVAAFAAVALLHGMVVAAVDRRLSLAWLPWRPPPLPPRSLLAGRIAVAAAALIALPGFLGALADIL